MRQELQVPDKKGRLLSLPFLLPAHKKICLLFPYHFDPVLRSACSLQLQPAVCCLQLQLYVHAVCVFGSERRFSISLCMAVCRLQAGCLLILTPYSSMIWLILFRFFSRYGRYFKNRDGMGQKQALVAFSGSFCCFLGRRCSKLNL